MNTGIVILAAGNSSRLGKPKQLLEFRNETLLQGVINAALQTDFSPLIVVLGAYAEEITKKLPSNIDYILNENWSEGMSSSIAVGIAAVIEKSPSVENIIIAVSDQAFITVEIFKALIIKHNSTKKGIIASSYAETIGTPTLFNKQYFHQLLSLNGNTGAKAILKSNHNDVETISFELGYIDIDTETDYHNLIKN